MSDLCAEIKRRLLVLYPEQHFEGASEEEIQALEAYAGGSLPTVYRGLLKEFGRSAGELFQGTIYSVSQEQRLRLRSLAESMLGRSRGNPTLPETAFVYLVFQDWVFFYFPLNEGDDPPVYAYIDSGRGLQQVGPSLSSYLRSSLDSIELSEHARRYPHPFQG